MTAAQLKKILAKVPDDVEIEISLDSLDFDEPRRGDLDDAKLTLSDPQKLELIATETSSEDDDEEEEE